MLQKRGQKTELCCIRVSNRIANKAEKIHFLISYMDQLSHQPVNCIKLRMGNCLPVSYITDVLVRNCSVVLV